MRRPDAARRRLPRLPQLRQHQRLQLTGGVLLGRSRPIHVGLVVGLLTLLFVGARLLVVAERDISRFVVAGTGYTNPAAVDPPIHVFDSPGYDGQFYWRLATNPAETGMEPYRGVALDFEYRVTRIGYPALVFGASFGQAGWVRWGLVLVNVVGMAVIGGAAAACCRARNRQALVGLAAAASSGLVFSVSRDLCEVTMIAALTAGVALMMRGRFGWAAAAWALACLIHEQALFMVVPYALYRIAQAARRRRWRPAREDLPWLAGGTAFAAWQVVMRVAHGTFPALAAGDASVGLPFVGLAEQIDSWRTHGLPWRDVLVVPQMALLIALVVVAARRVRGLAEADRWLAWSLAGAVVVAASLSQAVWFGPADLRQIVVVWTAAWLVVLASPRPVPVPLLGATAAVWMATAAMRVAVI